MSQKWLIGICSDPFNILLYCGDFQGGNANFEKMWVKLKGFYIGSSNSWTFSVFKAFQVLYFLIGKNWYHTIDAIRF